MVDSPGKGVRVIQRGPVANEVILPRRVDDVGHCRVRLEELLHRPKDQSLRDYVADLHACRRSEPCPQRLLEMSRGIGSDRCAVAAIEGIALKIGADLAR